MSKNPTPPPPRPHLDMFKRAVALAQLIRSSDGFAWDDLGKHNQQERGEDGGNRSQGTLFET